MHELFRVCENCLCTYERYILLRLKRSILKASKQIILLIALHVLLAIYSGTDVFSKYAAQAQFFSSPFFICWFVVLVILGIYAIGWQQIIRHMSLSGAFLNKAITIVWGIFWGVLLFNESLTIGKIIGALLIIAGIVLFVLSDKDQKAQS